MWTDVKINNLLESSYILQTHTLDNSSRTRNYKPALSNLNFTDTRSRVTKCDFIRKTNLEPTLFPYQSCYGITCTTHYTGTQVVAINEQACLLLLHSTCFRGLFFFPPCRHVCNRKSTSSIQSAMLPGSLFLVGCSKTFIAGSDFISDIKHLRTMDK